MSSEVHQAHEAAEQMTPTAYISEHLQNLTSTGEHQASIIDFSVINLDTIFWASLMGLLAVFILLIAARRATPGVPGRFQCFVEMIVEMVDTQAKSIVHGNRTFIAPLALFVFFWIILLNTLDLIPVDWVLGVNHFIEGFGVHVPHHRLVPTTDLNATMGMSL
jgi:F-type H+-transporting ATPase subunit a